MYNPDNVYVWGDVPVNSVFRVYREPSHGMFVKVSHFYAVKWEWSLNYFLIMREFEAALWALNLTAAYNCYAEIRDCPHVFWYSFFSDKLLVSSTVDN